MKNLDIVAKESAKGVTPLYYSVVEDAVYTQGGEGRWYVTCLIRKNTEQEIERVVRRYLAL